MADDAAPGRDVGAEETAALVQRMASDLVPLLRDDGPQRPLLLAGIARGGIFVARALCGALDERGIGSEVGTLDTSFHRDDFGRRGLRTGSAPSELPLTLEDARVVLVDDVLHTGRTVRAALEALFERGRPHCVRLAALVARPGRQLPIQADIVGLRMDVPESAHVQVLPDPLRITLERSTA